MTQYLDNSSIPATKSELDLFSIYPTQTAIEGSYEIEYRPIGSIEPANMMEFVIPASEHFTDLESCNFHAKIKIETDAMETEKVTSAYNYTSSLLEQVDVYLGTKNITPGGNVYHYQVFLEDLLFNHESKLDELKLIIADEAKRKEKISKEFDFIFPLNSPIFCQEKLLMNDISLRLKRAPMTFGVVSDDEISSLKVMFNHFTFFVRRVN